MPKINFRLLKVEEVFGPNRLSIFEDEKNLLGCLSDFTCGQKISETDNGVYAKYYWLIDESEGMDTKKVVYCTEGIENNQYKISLADMPILSKDVGIRLAFKVPKELQKQVEKGILKFGHYPRNLIDHTDPEYKYLRDMFLNPKYNSGKKIMTKFFDEIGYSPNEYKIFELDIDTEYEILVGNYIKAPLGDNVNYYNKTNGKNYTEKSHVFYHISDVQWLYDEETEIAVSKNIITSQIVYNDGYNRYTNYTNSSINSFIRRELRNDLVCFVNERELQNMDFNGIVPLEKFKRDSHDEALEKFEKAEEWIKQNNIEIEELLKSNNKNKVTVKKTRLQSMNKDDSKIKRDMTYTEMIHNWIEAGRSVLLRGPSGIGKTERIETLYPNRIFIKLTNGMFPEKVVGSVNLQTGEAIPPSFAKDAVLLCATDEEKEMVKNNIQYLYELSEIIYERSKKEDEKVVILLDELLNVKPQIQSLVYSIVLNKFVESGSGIKLPKNVVIVGTGNQKKYSKVAEDLAEPLEKRFDHILDMEPKVSEWLSKYAIPNNVHPTVVSYMYKNYISKNKSDNLNDIGYFYEEPEVGEANLDRYGSNGKTNDPRGWVSISNMLYSFESDMKNNKFIGYNIEKFLEKSLLTKLRSEWAQDFYNYYNVPLISKEDIVDRNYSKSDLPTNINERLSYVTHLINANEDEVEECRDFIKINCDPEYLELYDMYWIGNDNTRREFITSLKEVKSLVRK